MIKKDGIALKSLILAAGYGTRLKPLTNLIPKPLAPVYGIPLLEAAAFRALEAGARAMAVNGHYLVETLKDFIFKESEFLKNRGIHLSVEAPEILGTGGCLVPLKLWLQGSPLLVYNGDILSDMDLSLLWKAHRKNQSLVTMAIRKEAPPPSSRSLWVHKSGALFDIAKPEERRPGSSKEDLEEASFACAYIAEPEFWDYLPSSPEFFDVVTGFKKALLQGHHIQTLAFDGFWRDIGTLKALWEANLEVAQFGEKQKEKLFGPLLKAHPVIHLGDSLIHPETTLEVGAKLSKTLLLKGAKVAAHENLQRRIRGLGVDETF